MEVWLDYAEELADCTGGPLGGDEEDVADAESDAEVNGKHKNQQKYGVALPKVKMAKLILRNVRTSQGL